MVIFSMIGVCGCMSNETGITKEVQEYLKSKYNKDFTVESFNSRGLDSPYDELICLSPENEEFTVYVDYSDNGKTISDNYYGLIKKADYANLVKGIIDKNISDYKYYFRFTANYFDSEFTEDVDIKQAISGNAQQFFTRNYIFVDENRADEIDEATFESLCAGFKEQGMTLFVAVYKVPSDVYGDMNADDDYNSYLSQDFCQNALFEKTVK